MKVRLGIVCARLGITPKQLRDWERAGLVAPTRGPGNQRLYTEADLRRLEHAKRLRDAGLALKETRFVLTVLEGSALGAEAHALRVLRTVLERIGVQLALTRALADAVAARLVRRSGNTPRP